MSQRKLLKIKRELDFLSIKMHLSGFDIYDLNLQLQQLRNDLLASKLDMKRDTEKLFDSEVDQHQWGNEVNFDLPPKFDEYEDKQEEVEEEEKKDQEEKDDNTFEEIMEEAREEELLVLRRVPSQQEGVQDEPPNLSPTPLTSKTLKPTFCHEHSNSLLTTPNLELRVSKEVVHDMFKESPISNILIRKGRTKKRVSKFKRDLFSWLILFQPELKKGEEVIT